MKNKEQSIPSMSDLEKAYDVLLGAFGSQSESQIESQIESMTKSLQKYSLSVEEMTKYINWSRFDPRLAEILVFYLARHWSELNPLVLREKILSSACPATLGVLLEFSLLLEKKDNRKKSLFSKWVELVTHEIPQSDLQLYFVGLRPLGSEFLLEDAMLSWKEYEKWGFLSRENLLAKKGKGHLSWEKRQVVLKEIAQLSKPIRSSDYWEAVGKSISLRQAERDLQESGLFRAKGRTKSRRWFPK